VLIGTPPGSSPPAVPGVAAVPAALPATLLSTRRHDFQLAASWSDVCRRELARSAGLLLDAAGMWSNPSDE
jgi:hypothetical protein